jgi:hypothetical protein
VEAERLPGNQHFNLSHCFKETASTPHIL